MVNSFIIKKEHELIERELVELEENIGAEVVNYPNVIHVFSRLHNLWDEHERKEEEYFKFLREDGLKVDIEKMQFAHKELKGFYTVIKESLKSASEIELKLTLENDLRMLIEKLRHHMKEEEKFLK